LFIDLVFDYIKPSIFSKTESFVGVNKDFLMIPEFDIKLSLDYCEYPFNTLLVIN